MYFSLALCQTKQSWSMAKISKFFWSFCFELKVLNESKYSLAWDCCALGKVYDIDPSCSLPFPPPSLNARVKCFFAFSYRKETILTCLISGRWSRPMSFTIWVLIAAIFLALLNALLDFPITIKVVRILKRAVLTVLTHIPTTQLTWPGLALKWQVLQVCLWLTAGFPGSQSLCRHLTKNVSSLSPFHLAITSQQPLKDSQQCAPPPWRALH